MFCASLYCRLIAIFRRLCFLVSGEAPEQPVVSKKSGHVFERRLIEKFVQEQGRCPVTGDALSQDDLVALKGVLHFSVFSFSCQLNIF